MKPNIARPARPPRIPPATGPAETADELLPVGVVLMVDAAESSGVLAGE